MRTLHLSKSAELDFDHALLFHIGYSDQIGEKFYGDMELALEQIKTHPEASSHRLGQELNIAGLRAWHLKKFNARVVYPFTDSDVITVARIFHGSQNLSRDQLIDLTSVSIATL